MIKQLSVRELADKVEAATGPITDWQFLDVREPWEFQMAAIKHPNCPVTHIPMSIVPLRQNELDPAKPLVVICRSGNRSVDAGLALEAAGFTQVINVLEGFEGPLDDDYHRGTQGGWRFRGLPWYQT